MSLSKIHLGKVKPSAHVPPDIAQVKPEIGIDVLEKIDIRVGTILLVEEVRNSENLVRLTVDFGNHTRKILSGMKKERIDVQEICGKQALFVVNLKPRKIMGEISEGLLFDIGFADGINPALAVPERIVPNGAKAG
ncbi:MAG: tRNA-binding protein [Thaumarchaeota archaeon]|nr:tRNA-binding protein [Nitrososphaerota archaeon]